MPSLVIQKISRTSADPLVDCRCLKAGMVIDVQHDGIDWGVEGRKNPEWEIVNTTMDREEAAALLEEEAGDPLENPFLQIRRLYIDFSSLPPGTFAKLKGKRGAPLSIGKNALRKAIRAVPTIPNPMVLG